MLRFGSLTGGLFCGLAVDKPGETRYKKRGGSAAGRRRFVQRSNDDDMSELRGAAAAVVLFLLPFLASIAVGRFASRGRWLSRGLFIVSIFLALAIAYTLTDRNRAGYRVLVFVVEMPLGLGALVAAAAGTLAGLAVGERLRRRG